MRTRPLAHLRSCAPVLAVAAPLAALYLILAPPAGDLAAATYRSDLFARVSFTTWDTGWYAAHGHWLPGYSLLSPALGALFGVRLLLALSALAASVLFALIAELAFGRTGAGGSSTAADGAPKRDHASAARPAADWGQERDRGVSAAAVASVVFAFGVCVGMLSGRVPYYLGLAISLGAVLALIRGRPALALALATLSSVASPVAGAFLALAGLAVAGAWWFTQTAASCAHARARAAPIFEDDDVRPGQLGDDARVGRLGAGIALAALVPIAVLGIAFPEGGYEPFAASAFWPALAGVLLFALLLPRGPLTPRAHTTLRLGAALYALALIGAYVLHTPMGGNAARLGPLLAAPLVAGVLWERRRTALLVLAPLLLYWQIVTPVRDLASIAGDTSVNASYYAPLIGELRRLDARVLATDARPQHLARARVRAGLSLGGTRVASLEGAGGSRTTIVEVPMTRAHWEAAYLAGAPLPDGGRVALARGWERQLDTRYASLFYRPTLTAGAYRAWLARNRVRYVALPDVPLDSAGRLEGRLVARGVPYLRGIWHSAHWRLYRFIG